MLIIERKKFAIFKDINTMLIVFLMSMPSYSQTPSFIHFNVQSGIPSNLTHCGLQDTKKYLWFATEKGLSFFNGKEFQNYNMTNGLPDPEVINLMEDSKRRIWISCFRKKLCYIEKRKIYTENDDFVLDAIDIQTGICNFLKTQIVVFG